jgi:hypothetical protein
MAGEIGKMFPGCAECARLHEAWLAVKDEPHRDVKGRLMVPASWVRLSVETATHQRWVHDWPPDKPPEADRKHNRYRRRLPDGT